MKRNKIFLSYRRDDSPGYVSRLEDELERTFGDDRVFRDATDIPGGKKWKNVIDANLHSSAVLLLVIGPRWEKIWRERKDDEVNYVAMELERARELDVPIIPVTLDGTVLSKDLDLGKLSFIYENQFHDICDRQGRWRGDFARLVRLLEGIDGIGPANREDNKQPDKPEGKKSSTLKNVGIAAALLLVVGIWAAMQSEPGPYPSPEPTPGPVPGPGPDPIPPVDIDYDTAIPDIGGTWQGEDGTLYYVLQYGDGSFEVQSPGYGSGRGQFFANMPRKFQIQMFGIGQGEFSVSASGDRAVGWIMVDGQQEYDTLVRIE